MISQSEKTNPIQSQFLKGQNERKLTYNKGLQKKRHFRSPKKQTQSNPKRSGDPYGWASRNPQTGDQFQRQKNAQALIFRTFFAIFAHFLTIFLSFSHYFSNVFEYFQTFLNVFDRFFLAQLPQLASPHLSGSRHYPEKLPPKSRKSKCPISPPAKRPGQCYRPAGRNNNYQC